MLQMLSSKGGGSFHPNSGPIEITIEDTQTTIRITPAFFSVMIVGYFKQYFTPIYLSIEIMHRLMIEAVQHSTSTAAQMLQNTLPKTQHPRTSKDAEKGSTMILRSKSAIARLIMKKFVTVCKCRLQTTERITKMFPTIATNINTDKKTPTPMT
uniref:Uncharacterized protein n=1 Tax=Anguilla anguilla TaxID=7936 RepID=A0A0E9WTN3_ANGAN